MNHIISCPSAIRKRTLSGEVAKSARWRVLNVSGLLLISPSPLLQVLQQSVSRSGQCWDFTSMILGRYRRVGSHFPGTQLDGKDETEIEIKGHEWFLLSVLTLICEYEWFRSSVQPRVLCCSATSIAAVRCLSSCCAGEFVTKTWACKRRCKHAPDPVTLCSLLS